MKTKTLAVNSEPVEMLSNILRYVLLPAGSGLNLHPLALCSHLPSAKIQQKNKHCVSWMPFKRGSERCLLGAGGTTTLSQSKGLAGILGCQLLMELLSRCYCLRLVFHGDVLRFKPSARSQTTNVGKEGRTCCSRAVIACRRCRFKFWLCYRFPTWPCTNIPVHQLP